VPLWADFLAGRPCGDKRSQTGHNQTFTKVIGSLKRETPRCETRQNRFSPGPDIENGHWGGKKKTAKAQACRGGGAGFTGDKKSVGVGARELFQRTCENATSALLGVGQETCWKEGSEWSEIEKTEGNERHRWENRTAGVWGNERSGKFLQVPFQNIKKEGGRENQSQ